MKRNYFNALTNYIQTKKINSIFRKLLIEEYLAEHITNNMKERKNTEQDHELYLDLKI